MCVRSGSGHLRSWTDRGAAGRRAVWLRCIAGAAEAGDQLARIACRAESIRPRDAGGTARGNTGGAARTAGDGPAHRGDASPRVTAARGEAAAAAGAVGARSGGLLLAAAPSVCGGGPGV